MSKIDDKYEFNAPREYCFLTENIEVDGYDESFFDCPTNPVDGANPKTPKRGAIPRTPRSTRRTAKNKTPAKVLPVETNSITPNKNLQSESNTKITADISTSEIKSNNNETTVANEEPMSDESTHKDSPVVSNVNQTENNDEIIGDTNEEVVEMEGVEHSDKDVSEENCNEEPPVYNPTLRDITEEIPSRHSPRLAALAKALHKNKTVRSDRSQGPVRAIRNGRRRSYSADAKLSTRGTVSSKSKQASKNRLIHKVTGMKGLTDEDKRDLDSITQFSQKLSLNRKKVDGNTSIIKNVAKLLPTKPKEFSFATTSRLRSRSEDRNDKEVDYVRSLRSNKISTKDGPKGATVPVPFNLSVPNKQKPVQSTEFVSLAELNLKFHTRTPTRFKTRPSEQVISKPSRGVTIPITPELNTRTRSRGAPVDALTREETEEKELEEAQKHKFKANPLNKKVFDEPTTGYYKDRKLPTVPEPFNITDTKKTIGKVQQSNLKDMCEKFGGTTSSLASLPHAGIPAIWDKTTTKLKPFSFDNRDRNSKLRKDEKIVKTVEDEKKLSEFHANPMPVFEDGIRGVPLKKPPTPTKLQPFNHYADQRGEKKKDVMSKKQIEFEEDDKMKRTFRAGSDAVLHKEPFIPAKSNKPLTDISGFTLNTEKRSEDRAVYDVHLKQKEGDIKEQKIALEDQKIAEEEAQVAQQRRDAVHKAQPVKHYKAVEIKHSDRSITVPISPKFATNTRLRSSSRASSTLSLANSDHTFTSK